MTNATMRAYGLAVALALLALAGPAAAATSSACKACHADFAAVLPSGHPPAKGTALGACLGCHPPGAKGEARNGFAAALHRVHAKGDGGLACAACHTVVAKGRPGVARGKVVLVASRETMAVATATMTAAGADRWTAGVHAKAGVSCASCHGAGVPPPGAEAGNERCLACHGPLDALVEKTKPAEHADRNPHRSHLGEIACTVCHRGHEASTVYCLDCHPKFPMALRTGTPR